VRGAARLWGDLRLVHHTVPHLVAPDFLPRAQARERALDPLAETIAGAGRAVQAGAGHSPAHLVAGR
jgi:hypothetical protein